MTATAFVKIATVLQIVRSAIGAQGVPSSTVIMALAAALTLIAMAPVGDRIAARAGPLLEGAGAAGLTGPPGAAGGHTNAIDTVALVRGGIDAVREPLRDFFKANAREAERQRFFDVARRARHRQASGGGGVTGGGVTGALGNPAPDDVTPDDLTVLLPAFVVTELSEAFAIGFLIYLPFLVIDLVVSNLLLALGMQMMSPTQVSLPFKLLLFVAIDGWGLLAKSLVQGYR
jgi:type III secretion protein R